MSDSDEMPGGCRAVLALIILGVGGWVGYLTFDHLNGTDDWSKNRRAAFAEHERQRVEAVELERRKVEALERIAQQPPVPVESSK